MRLFVFLLCGAAAAAPVPRWTRFEQSFTAASSYQNPVQEQMLTAEFVSPDGKRATVHGFWDGGATWRVRFSPSRTGMWKWSTHASKPDSGLAGKSGAFECVAYSGSNPVYHGGPVRVSANRHHLERADATPFFWMGDTVWNGPLKATAADWDRFLQDRAAKQFNVIQYIATSWRAGPKDENGRTAWTGRERIVIDPAFFQRMDARVSAINERGFIAAPVLLWANRDDSPENPSSLPDDQMILLGRYLVARYGAHQVVWLLNGDGDYTGPHVDRWKKAGRAIFSGGHPERISTQHPGRLRWMTDLYIGEDWFHFNGYQSGHRDDDEHLRWLTQGPPSKSWRKDPHIPVLNIEPNYEAHNSRSAVSRHVFNDYDVRRAAYWSLLVAPPAGLTYGAHGVWSWESEPTEPLGHAGTGIAPPWHKAMSLPGSTQMKHLVDLFTSFDWYRLRPAQEMLAAQPGAADPRRFQVIARATDASFALAYLPVGGSLRLKPDAAAWKSARWFDPRRGLWSNARVAPAMSAPDQQDWVLWLGK